MNLLDLFRQLSHLAGLPVVILAGVGAVLVVVPRDWRVVLFGYTLVSVMLALLLAQIIPVQWALLQAIVGGLIAVMLFLSARQLRWRLGSSVSWEARWPQVASLTSFRLMAVALAAVGFFAMHTELEIPKIEPLFRDAVLWLSVMGLLGLALHEEPLHAGLALLTLLGGFLLLLFSLVQRRMLIGLVDAGQLLLGLAIAYLALSRGLTMAEPRSKSSASEWRV